MITELAINELNTVLVDMRNKYKHSTMTIGEAIKAMPREELELLVARLLFAAHRVVISRL